MRQNYSTGRSGVTRIGFVSSAVMLLAVAFPAAAQDQVAIDGGSATGVTNVNAAAGDNNQQLNAGAIASGGLAVSTAHASQTAGSPGASSGATSTTIAPGAFAGSSGWIAVNGASGNDNQQANLALFAFGIEAGAAADALLSQTRASSEPAGGTATNAAEPDRIIAIGEGAFAGSSGLVQVSLIGGDRNSSANSFALSVSGPATP